MLSTPVCWKMLVTRAYLHTFSNGRRSNNSGCLMYVQDGEISNDGVCCVYRRFTMYSGSLCQPGLKCATTTLGSACDAPCVYSDVGHTPRYFLSASMSVRSAKPVCSQNLTAGLHMTHTPFDVFCNVHAVFYACLLVENQPI